MSDWKRKLFKPEVNEMLDKGMDLFLVCAIMQSRKEIKEIGVRVEPDKDSVTQFELYTSYTDAERRAFARALIDAWNKKLFGERRATIPDVEEFIKENEL